MLEHRTAGLVHTAVENDIRILRLDLGEDCLKVGFGIGGLLVGDDADLGGLERLFNFLGKAFTVGSLIVGDRHFFALQFAGDVSRDCRTLLIVTTNRAEHRLQTTLSQCWVGGRTGNHRDASFVINFRRGN